MLLLQYKDDRIHSRSFRTLPCSPERYCCKKPDAISHSVRSSRSNYPRPSTWYSNEFTKSRTRWDIYNLGTFTLLWLKKHPVISPDFKNYFLSFFLVKVFSSTQRHNSKHNISLAFYVLQVLIVLLHRS